MIQARIITFEGELTDTDRKTLVQLRETEPFRLLRKLCAQEYLKIASRMTDLDPTVDMKLAQGQLVGIKGIYNMLMTLGVEEKKPIALPKHVEILENAKKRGSKI